MMKLKVNESKMSCLMTEDTALLCRDFLNVAIKACGISEFVALAGSPLFHDGEGGTHTVSYLKRDPDTHEWVGTSPRVII